MLYPAGLLKVVSRVPFESNLAIQNSKPQYPPKRISPVD